MVVKLRTINRTFEYSMILSGCFLIETFNPRHDAITSASKKQLAIQNILACESTYYICSINSVTMGWRWRLVVCRCLKDNECTVYPSCGKAERCPGAWSWSLKTCPGTVPSSCSSYHTWISTSPCSSCTPFAIYFQATIFASLQATFASSLGTVANMLVSVLTTERILGWLTLAYRLAIPSVVNLIPRAETAVGDVLAFLRRS